MLVRAGADLVKASGGGTTPLIVAAFKGHSTAAVEWLLSRGADWRLTRVDGKTALDYAKEGGTSEAVAALEAWIAEHGSAEEVAEMERQNKKQGPTRMQLA